jgi:hypothetical protein
LQHLAKWRPGDFIFSRILFRTRQSHTANSINSWVDVAIRQK